MGKYGSTCSCGGGICQGLCSKTGSICGFPRNARLSWHQELAWTIAWRFCSINQRSFSICLLKKTGYTWLLMFKASSSGNGTVQSAEVFFSRDLALLSPSGWNVAVLFLNWCFFGITRLWFAMIFKLWAQLFALGKNTLHKQRDTHSLLLSWRCLAVNVITWFIWLSVSPPTKFIFFCNILLMSRVFTNHVSQTCIIYVLLSVWIGSYKSCDWSHMETKIWVLQINGQHWVKNPDHSVERAKMNF